MPIGTIIGFCAALMFVGLSVGLSNNKNSPPQVVGTGMFWIGTFSLIGTLVEMFLT